MKREIEYTPTFAKKASKLLKATPSLKDVLIDVLDKLSQDIKHPSLHTHALKGKLAGTYACSLTYNLRIVFCLTPNSIKLINIGSHDEVYD